MVSIHDFIVDTDVVFNVFTRGSEILAREISRQFWDNLHSTKYGLIFVTKSGIMHKDIGGYNKETGMFKLLSRNPQHKEFEYPANDVYQIFNVIKRSF